MPKTLNVEGEEVEVKVGDVVYLNGELISMTVTGFNKEGELICTWLDMDLNPMSYYLPAAAVWVGHKPSDTDEEEDDDGD